MDPDPIAEALSAYLHAADAYSDFTFPFFEGVGGDRGRQVTALHDALQQARGDYLALVEPAEPPEPAVSAETAEPAVSTGTAEPAAPPEASGE